MCSTTDDYVAVQALVRADLGGAVSACVVPAGGVLPVGEEWHAGGRARHVFAVRYGNPPDPLAVNLLTDALRSAAEPAGQPVSPSG